MALPPVLQNLRIPVIGAPMFLVSNPDLVVAQCSSGIVGAFPAFNAREEEGAPIELDRWITLIKEGCDRHNQTHPERPAAPFATNLIMHRSNTRLERDLEICVKQEVPIMITSLGAREEVYEAVRSYGGITLHDIINNRFAKKAIEKGADGLIAVGAGAGGHAGTTSPFALAQEIREWFDGPLVLSGCIARGDSVLAAEAMGADLSYVGSAFIATEEASAADGYKQMIVESAADDIIYTDLMSGLHSSYLKGSMRNAGLDPDDLATSVASALKSVEGSSAGAKWKDDSSRPKAWKDIWSAGQGIGAIKDVPAAAELVDRLEREYLAARERVGLGGDGA